MLTDSYSTCLLVSEENETVIQVEDEKKGKVFTFFLFYTQWLELFQSLILHSLPLHCCQWNQDRQWRVCSHYLFLLPDCSLERFYWISSSLFFLHSLYSYNTRKTHERTNHDRRHHHQYIVAFDPLVSYSILPTVSSSQLICEPFLLFSGWIVQYRLPCFDWIDFCRLQKGENGEKQLTNLKDNFVSIILTKSFLICCLHSRAVGWNSSSNSLFSTTSKSSNIVTIFDEIFSP